METQGILKSLAIWMNINLRDMNIIVAFTGLVSSIIDNVPLTAAAMGMYGLSVYPSDAKFWEMMVYCVGTGGSILIIGSAAGVVVMNMEKISCFNGIFCRNSYILGFLQINGLICMYKKLTN